MTEAVSAPSRSRGIVSRADLLQALQIAEVDWFALPHTESLTGGGFLKTVVQEPQSLTPELPAFLVDEQPDEVVQNAPLQMLDCWAVTTEIGLDDADDLDLSSTNLPLIAPSAKASAQQTCAAARGWMTSGTRLAWPQLHSAMRAALCSQRLARRRPIDWERVARRVAQARSLRPLPRRAVRRWPANLVLALDRGSPALTPFVDDMDLMADHLLRAVGHRAVDVRLLAGNPQARFGRWSFKQIDHDVAAWKPLFGESMVLISDCAVGDQGRRPQFDAWLHKMAHGGSEITLLGVGLSAQHALPPSVLRQPWFPAAALHESDVADLLSLVTMIGAASDGLLRALAQVIRPGPPPLDLIWSAWNHRAMVVDGRHCWLRPDASAAYESRLLEMDAAIVQAALNLIRQLRAQLGEADTHLTELRVSELAPQSRQFSGSAQAQAAATDYLQRRLPDLWQAADPEGRESLGSKIRRMVQVAHPSVVRRHRQSLERLLRLSSAAGLRDGLRNALKQSALVAWKLVRAGASLRLLRADQRWGGLVLADQIGAAPDSLVCVRVGDQQSWQLLDQSDVELADLNAPVSKIQIEFSDRRIALDRLSRPSWARAWDSNGDTVYAVCQSYWGKELRLPYLDCLRFDSRLTTAGGEFGVDQYGLYADMCVDSVTQRFRWIEPGEFLMGSPENESDRGENEGPQHRVRISEGYWLGDTACTQAFWLAVMGGDNPSQFSDDLQNPVEQVSWDDVQAFLRKLQQKLPEGNEPALPTEAQWEYACRAGTISPFSPGENVTTAKANFNGDYLYADAAKGEYREKTVPVRSLAPSRWGLYEMHGNVDEWCADDLREYPQIAASGVVVDPVGPTEPGPRTIRGGGSWFGMAGRRVSRVVRGGSWFDGAQYARSAYRYAYGRDYRYDRIGFRLSLRSKSPVSEEGDPRTGGAEAGEGNSAQKASGKKRWDVAAARSVGFVEPVGKEP